MTDITLLHGDCLEIVRDIPDGSIDLLLTDIPFNISKQSNFRTMKNRRFRNGIDFGEWDKGFDTSCLSLFVPKIKKGGSLIVFHAIEQFTPICSALNGMELKDRLVWQKTNPMPRNRDRRYISNIEHLAWFVKPGDKWTFNRRNSTYDGCVLTYPSESGGGFKRYHPCQKNVKMLEELILRHSNPGDLVLDPFMGAGSTAVACRNTGRGFIGVEIEQRYFEIAHLRTFDTPVKEVISDGMAERIQQAE